MRKISNSANALFMEKAPGFAKTHWM